MKISDLVKKTGVSKETIHYYIREGVLGKPRKTGKNSADYSDDFVDQIRIVKALRENYFLPIPVIKKLIKKHKKQSPSDRSSFRFLSEHFKPLDRLFSGEVSGREAFMAATGIGEKWLTKMEEWRVITAEFREGERIYSQDDVIIGKLLVDMDRIGIGPRDGFDPVELKSFTDWFREFVAKNVERFMQIGWSQMSCEDLKKKGIQSTEVMSLFFYHIYRKMAKEEYRAYIRASEVRPSRPEE